VDGFFEMVSGASLDALRSKKSPGRSRQVAKPRKFFLAIFCLKSEA